MRTYDVIVCVYEEFLIPGECESIAHRFERVIGVKAEVDGGGAGHITYRFRLMTEKRRNVAEKSAKQLASRLNTKGKPKCAVGIGGSVTV